MGVNEISQMSAIEKIQTMEMLWDALSKNEQELPSPEWHGDVLKERAQQLQSGQARKIPLSEAKTALR